MSANESRPSLDTGAALYESNLDVHDTGRPDFPVSPPVAANPVTVPASPEAWGALGGAYAVVVTRPGGRYRRRLYFSLDSAQRQAGRARARGEHTHLALVRLVPCGEVAP